jgi:hypothetical protein
VSWALVAFLVSPAVGQALDGRSAAVTAVAAALGWLLWTAALVATLVPRTTSLTVYRTIAPGTLVAAVWSALGGGGPLATAVAVASAALAVVVAFLSVTGDVFVDGSSYGPERRLALRPPATLVLGVVQVTWLVAFGGLVAGPLLLAARQWVFGGVLLAAGWPAAWYALQRLHLLARRWVVFVPAGLVVHDPITLADAALFARRSIVAVRPAPVDNPSIDLTRNALGLAIEILFDQPQELSISPGRRQPPDSVAVRGVLCTPSRPAAFLDAARGHRLPVPVGPSHTAVPPPTTSSPS